MLGICIEEIVNETTWYFKNIQIWKCYLVILYKNCSHIVNSMTDFSFSCRDILHNRFPKHKWFCNVWPRRVFRSNNSFIMSYQTAATNDLSSSPEAIGDLQIKLRFICNFGRWKLRIDYAVVVFSNLRKLLVHASFVAPHLSPFLTVSQSF